MLRRGVKLVAVFVRLLTAHPIQNDDVDAALELQSSFEKGNRSYDY